MKSCINWDVEDWWHVAKQNTKFTAYKIHAINFNQGQKCYRTRNLVQCKVHIPNNTI